MTIKSDTRSSDEAVLHEMLAQEGLMQEEHWGQYFAHHSRSFSFAAKLFPSKQRQQVAGVYAYSRFTDDLVDGEHDMDPEQQRRLVKLWQEMSEQAYQSQNTGIFLLDKVMGTMSDRGVPFTYANELIEGVRMDLEWTRYPDMHSLCLYAYRVASTVGLWLTELFGTNDAWMLSRASALGEAMQITNILRDVGEDLDRDRVYLPADRMEAHGVTFELLQELRKGGPIPENYAAFIEELLQDAELRYEEAFVAIPGLPVFFQKPVIVAAYVYRGIHNEIRRNGYNNFTLRAHTSFWQKLWLGWKALRQLRRETKMYRLGSRPARKTLSVFQKQRECAAS